MGSGAASSAFRSPTLSSTGPERWPSGTPCGGFDAIHLASVARLGKRFDDLHFLAFDARLVEAARGASVPVYERV
jgi:hypothetical protein